MGEAKSSVKCKAIWDHRLEACSGYRQYMCETDTFGMIQTHKMTLDLAIITTYLLISYLLIYSLVDTVLSFSWTSLSNHHHNINRCYCFLFFLFFKPHSRLCLLSLEREEGREILNPQPFWCMGWHSNRRNHLAGASRCYYCSRFQVRMQGLEMSRQVRTPRMTQWSAASGDLMLFTLPFHVLHSPGVSTFCEHSLGTSFCI